MLSSCYCGIRLILPYQLLETYVLLKADAYLNGLNDYDAAQITKKYSIHRVMDSGYKKELKDAPLPGQRPV